jgi:hypothetical protein
MHDPRGFRPRSSNRRWSADQTSVRGGCSGGEYPKPSRQKSFSRRATPEATAKGGWKRAAVRPGKQLAQAAMKTHLSQSIGAGAFDGQQGMSPIIASAVAGADLSSVIADIDASDAVAAMTGRTNGASTRPAIMKIASIRRIMILRSMPQNPTNASKLKASQTNDAVM